MKLFNTLTKKKEEFIPINENKVSMYVCGQTVYDYCHLGHGRKAVAFDMIRRWFMTLGYEVTYVENITDIDDKIIERAKLNNETILQLTSRFINYMHEDFAKLGVLSPSVEPKATDYIPQMLEMIGGLIKKGYAYQSDNGDVYYAVRKFKDYGKLSGKSLQDLRSGTRVEVDIHKRDPLDFVLWKHSKDFEPFWPSEFGNGRPGWHIECSAMSEAILGNRFDIHGGGQDLQFPHHENEIAQSEAHNDCKFANYWLHNGFLNVNDEKMSKSLGNFATIRDILDSYDAEVVRMFMLKTHYRSPLNLTYETLNDAKHGITRLYGAIKDNDNTYLDNINWNNEYALKFKSAMDDDFNTPLALSILFELSSQINKNNNQEMVKILKFLANSIGLLLRTSTEFFQTGISISTFDIEEQINKRKEARANNDFELSDKIRQNLLMHGIILEDEKTGTIWRKK